MSLLPSAVVLGLVAWVAAVLARRRPSPPGREAERRSAARVLAVATAVQAVHFAEEAATGFHERFPALVGLPPMSFALFVGFNVAWLAIWVASVPGVGAGRRIAFFPAWFLALAGVLNGVAHPSFAVLVGGYFPGLATSPFIAAAAGWLATRLLAATGRTG
jgi:hypothetical protein